MKNIKKYLLNSLIVLYLAVIYYSGVPDANTFDWRLKQKANVVAFAVGIWPSWSMFAPNPIKFDSKSFVEITYKNGEIKEHDVEIDPQGVLAPFRRARWMKYSQDNLRHPDQRGLLDPALRHFYFKYNSEANPIASIVIKRKWRDVSPIVENKPLVSVLKDPRDPEKSEILVAHKVEK